MNIQNNHFLHHNDDFVTKLHEANENLFDISIENSQSFINENNNDANAKRKKKMFSKEEDKRLVKIINEYGDQDWSFISYFMPGRTKRQCRERWKKYLCPSLNHSPWTEKEDDLLISKYNKYGPKWALISKSFKHRTDINVKTRCITLLKKKKRNDNISNNTVENNVNFSKKNAEYIHILKSTNKNESNTLKCMEIITNQENMLNSNISQNNNLGDFHFDEFDLQIDNNTWDDMTQENSLLELDHFYYY